jgi:mannose-6-phosphate isomerase-like protein (cupin superfamily)
MNMQPMSSPAKEAFDLLSTYVHIEDGPAAKRVEVGEDFWAKIHTRHDLRDGRLVCMFRFSEDWTSWEMHPAGDEIVYVISGAIRVVLEENGAQREIELRERQGCIVPRGVWHTARVDAPSDVLHITRGGGTQHRPR